MRWNKITFIGVLFVASIIFFACEDGINGMEASQEPDIESTTAAEFTVPDHSFISEEHIAPASGYMQAREDVLTNKGDEGFDEIAVIGIVNDEKIHREILKEKKILIVDSKYTILKDWESDYELCLILLETVTYEEEGIEKTEDIEHEIFFMRNKSGRYVAAADLYTEKFTDFTSCSYVKPEER